MYRLCQPHAKRVTQAGVAEEAGVTGLTIKNSTIVDEILVEEAGEIAAEAVQENHRPRKMEEHDTTVTLTVVERKEVKPDERVEVGKAITPEDIETE